MEIGYLGANIGFGQGNPGVQRASRALREDGILESLQWSGAGLIDFGDLENPNENQTDVVYKKLAQKTCQVLRESEFPFIIGGDHSLSVSTISALLAFHPDLKVLWIDAHGDINSPTSSPSQNLHGMPLAALLGLFDPHEKFGFHLGRLKPDQICYLGVRDLDPGEEESLKALGITCFDMSKIRSLGMEKVLRKIRTEFLGGLPLHISFDLDALDPEYFSATGVPVSGGLQVSEFRKICALVENYQNLVSLEAVELNPDLGSASGLRRSMGAFHSLARAVSLRGRMHYELGAPVGTLSGHDDPENFALGAPVISL